MDKNEQNEPSKQGSRINFREMFNRWKPVLQVLLATNLALMPLNKDLLQNQQERVQPETEQVQPESERVEGALKNAIKTFYYEVASHNTNEAHGFLQAGQAQFTQDDKVMSEKFQQVFREAFLMDEAAQRIPIGESELDLMSEKLKFYFSPKCSTSRATGYFTDANVHRGEKTYAWTSTGRGSERFAGTVKHEIGHFFGLGESLTDLFTENLKGLDQPRHAGDWVNNSAFDRMLMEKVGEERLWKAAFTSEQAYRDLWNQYMPIDFDELQTTRGIHSTILGAGLWRGDPTFEPAQNHFTNLFKSEATLTDFDREELRKDIDWALSQGMTFGGYNGCIEEFIAYMHKAEKEMQGVLGTNQRFDQELQSFKNAMSENDAEGIAQFQEFISFVNEQKAHIDGAVIGPPRAVFDHFTFRQVTNQANKEMESENATQSQPGNRTFAFAQRFVSSLQNVVQRTRDRVTSFFRSDDNQVATEDVRVLKMTISEPEQEPVRMGVLGIRQEPNPKEPDNTPYELYSAKKDELIPVNCLRSKDATEKGRLDIVEKLGYTLQDGSSVTLNSVKNIPSAVQGMSPELKSVFGQKFLDGEKFPQKITEQVFKDMGQFFTPENIRQMQIQLNDVKTGSLPNQKPHDTQERIQ